MTTKIEQMLAEKWQPFPHPEGGVRLILPNQFVVARFHPEPGDESVRAAVRRHNDGAAVARYYVRGHTPECELGQIVREARALG